MVAAAISAPRAAAAAADAADAAAVRGVGRGAEGGGGVHGGGGAAVALSSCHDLYSPNNRTPNQTHSVRHTASAARTLKMKAASHR